MCRTKSLVNFVTKIIAIHFIYRLFFITCFTIPSLNLRIVPIFLSSQVSTAFNHVLRQSFTRFHHNSCHSYYFQVLNMLSSARRQNQNIGNHCKKTYANFLRDGIKSYCHLFLVVNIILNIIQ